MSVILCVFCDGGDGENAWVLILCSYLDKVSGSIPRIPTRLLNRDCRYIFLVHFLGFASECHHCMLHYRPSTLTKVSIRSQLGMENRYLCPWKDVIWKFQPLQFPVLNVYLCYLAYYWSFSL